MLFRGEVALGVVLTGLWIYCLVDAIMADEHRVRNLPKTAWVILILLTFEVGAVVWLVAGRPQGPSAPARRPTAYPEYDRPGRFAATNPDDDEEFLRRVRERADAQMREAKRQRAERERIEQERIERERERRRQRDAGGEPPAPPAPPGPAAEN